MKNKYQHLTEIKRNELLKLLQNFEYLFHGTLGTWKTSGRLQIKIGCEADMYKTISITVGARRKILNMLIV